MTPLKKIIDAHGWQVEKIAPWCDGRGLLTAIAVVESSFGVNVGPRHERAYDYGGIYQNKALLAAHGSFAAMSYSSWQIMFPVAFELGFKGTPSQLRHDEIAIYWVLEYLEHRIMRKGAEKLQDVFDAYNSGSFRDNIVPQTYIANGMNAYIKFMEQEKGDQNG